MMVESPAASIRRRLSAANLSRDNVASSCDHRYTSTSTQVVDVPAASDNPFKKKFLDIQRDRERGAKVAFANSYEEQLAVVKGRPRREKARRAFQRW